MKAYKLVFELDYKFFCWGIYESGLSGKIEEEIPLNGENEFTLRYQRGKINFKAKSVKSDADGVTVNMYRPDGRTVLLRLNEPAAFYYEEDFEEFTDCNSGVYEGKVTLEEV